MRRGGFINRFAQPTPAGPPTNLLLDNPPSNVSPSQVGQQAPAQINPGATDVNVDHLPIWLYPPINWENLDQIAYAALPAIGSTVTIIQFTVPLGRNGVIKKLANNFVGGGWVEGSGDVLWRILVDGAPPPGATSYKAIVASLGSPANPVEIAGFRVFENQTVTLVGLNNPAGPSGGVIVAGQRLGGRLVGYLYPRDLEPEDIWT